MSSGTRSQSSSSGQDPNTTPTIDDNVASTSGDTTIAFTPAQEEIIHQRFQEFMRQNMLSNRLEQSFSTPMVESGSTSSSAMAVSNTFPQEIETPGQTTLTHLYVDEKKYKQTSSDVLSSIRGCKITSNSSDNKKKIKTF